MEGAGEAMEMLGGIWGAVSSAKKGKKKKKAGKRNKKKKSSKKNKKKKGRKKQKKEEEKVVEEVFLPGRSRLAQRPQREEEEDRCTKRQSEAPPQNPASRQPQPSWL